MNHLLRKIQIIKGREGFTLLEIIFALAVLIIGVVGVLALFPVGLRASKRGGDFTMTTVLAQQQMENIKTAGWSVYGSNGWYNWDNAAAQLSYPGESTFPDDPNFSWVAYVEDLPSGTIANLKQVTLSIYWLDRGSQRSEDFTTYLADYQ